MLSSLRVLCSLFVFCTPLLVVGQPASQPLQKIICGDGFVDAGEACDDGNLVNGDGCNVLCVPEPLATQPASVASNPKKDLFEENTLVNPVVNEGPYYRSPKVALGLSAAPTIASFAALGATLVYRGVTDEKATTALSLSLVGASISPSLGMLYAQNPKLAFPLMLGRAAASGIFALGLALHRDDPNNDDDLDERCAGLGLSSLAVLTLAEVFSTPNAAKQAYPPGEKKPATIIKQ